MPERTCSGSGEDDGGRVVHGETLPATAGPGPPAPAAGTGATARRVETKRVPTSLTTVRLPPSAESTASSVKPWLQTKR
ncbi:MAG: hypothetical protein GX458_03360 [Phyllobacteriaceae bacterium]|nr:hypothetical protein [Phyllobacteriaceae bacterium]